VESFLAKRILSPQSTCDGKWCRPESKIPTECDGKRFAGTLRICAFTAWTSLTDRLCRGKTAPVSLTEDVPADLPAQKDS
jgi:hypothetical protein